ncbi:DUF302 domain-containing protein [Halomonas elongata]|uniref:DUF302 domain-containing protein n=1 Tax=Halomonas elongata TaxID=2746 RepID=UPI0023AF4C53|nr:DUF302 domain-containing protein [Halomonas elongata]
MKWIQRCMAFGLVVVLTSPVAADTHWPKEGWEVTHTSLGYEALLTSLKEAVDAEGMAVVTEAGPTEAAAQRDVTIPGNRVVGVFRNDYAVRLLRFSVPAMIEAPMRFYVTENKDGSATLSWKEPSYVLSPYEAATEEGAIEKIGQELDAIFSAIAERAVSETE